MAPPDRIGEIDHQGSMMVGIPSIRILGPQRVRWTPESLGGRITISVRRATMRFDITSEIVDDPQSAERLLWEGLR
jgi:hypothetical protein